MHGESTSTVRRPYHHVITTSLHLGFRVVMTPLLKAVLYSQELLLLLGALYQIHHIRLDSSRLQPRSSLMNPDWHMMLNMIG